MDAILDSRHSWQLSSVTGSAAIATTTMTTTTTTSSSIMVHDDDNDDDDDDLLSLSSSRSSRNSRSPDRYSEYDSDQGVDGDYHDDDDDSDGGDDDSDGDDDDSSSSDGYGISSEQSCRSATTSSGNHHQLWATEEIIANLFQNNLSRLELDDGMGAILDSLVRAVRDNRSVREVELHIEAVEGLSRSDQTVLADAICGLPELRSLLVYKNSFAFVEPLLRRGPPLLENLRLCKLDISSAPQNVPLLVSALSVLPRLKSLDVGFDSTDSRGVLWALSRMQPIYVRLECFRIDYKLQEHTTRTTTATTNGGPTTGNNNNNNNHADENNNNNTTVGGGHQPIGHRDDDDDYRHHHDPYMLDDRIVFAIAAAVETSQTLKTLSLPPFSCTDKCYDALISMLQTNCILERIDYWVRVCNLYYPDSNDVLDSLLHLNQSGVRALLRQEHPISSYLVVRVLTTTTASGDGDGHPCEDGDRHRAAVAVDLDAIYHLFSSDPSLLPSSML